MVDPVGFLVGPASQGAAKVLAIGAAVYAILTARHAAEAYRKRLEDRGSALVATFVMVGLAVVLWRHGDRLLPAPFSLTVLVIYLSGVTITLTYTLSNAEKRLAKWREDVKRIVEEWAEKALPEEQREAWMRLRLHEVDPEQKRKGPHLLMGVFVAIYVGLGWLILRGVQRAVPADAAVGENLHNLQAATDAGILAAGHMVGATFLLGLLFLLLPVEMVRLRFPDLGYPFKETITSLLRERERGLFGGHYYIAATLPLAVLWLTQDTTRWDTTLFAVLAVLGVTVFADAASALIGVRYGRNKWLHNRKKSVEGTVAGAVVAFAVALPFVGLPLAAASALAFVLVDVLAPVPISVSDNLLNPLALTATYLLLLDGLMPWIPYY